jgi:hypothetical protein
MSKKRLANCKVRGSKSWAKGARWIKRVRQERERVDRSRRGKREGIKGECKRGGKRREDDRMMGVDRK